MSRDVDLCRSLVYIWIMKKLMLLMLALVACVWGEVFIKDSIHIVFPQNIANYLGADDEKCFFGQLPNGKPARLYMNDYGGCVNDVCSSILDSSVFFMHEEVEAGDGCRYGFDYYSKGSDCLDFYFYILSDATHSLMDVISDEFKRFQECGLFDISSERLKSILSDMDSLVPKQEENHNYEAYVTDCGDGSGCLSDCYKTGPCFWLSEETSLNEILKKRNAQTSIPYHVDFAARITVENGRLFVPEGLESRAYMLYDLNGRVLRGGFLHNNMALPREPAILRVKDYGDVYLK